MIRWIFAIFIITFHKSCGIITEDPAYVRNNVDPDTYRNFEEILEEHGYGYNRHNVTTEDGYILTLFQIKIPVGVTKRDQEPILLSHGISCNSIVWLDINVEQSLGFILPKLGYDVWAANYRGNNYSQAHTHLETSSLKYWNFSFHELGVYDNPAIIDYITAYTGYKEIYYIAHSLGATALFITLAIKTQYNAKIKLALSMSPIAFFGNMVSPALKTVCPFWAIKGGKGKLFMDIDSPVYQRINDICIIEALTDTPAVCSAFLFSVSGVDPYLINATKMPVYFNHYPSGSSNRMLSHYCQLYYNKGFVEYDEFHGVDGHTESPPAYNLSAVTAPMGIIWGPNDALVQPGDLNLLRSHLPNIVLDMKVDYDLFTHVDFICATNAAELVYNPMMEFLNTNYP